MVHMPLGRVSGRLWGPVRCTIDIDVLTWLYHNELPGDKAWQRLTCIFEDSFDSYLISEASPTLHLPPTHRRDRLRTQIPFGTCDVLLWWAKHTKVRASGLARGLLTSAYTGAVESGLWVPQQ